MKRTRLTAEQIIRKLDTTTPCSRHACLQFQRVITRIPSSLEIAAMLWRPCSPIRLRTSALTASR